MTFIHTNLLKSITMLLQFTVKQDLPTLKKKKKQKTEINTLNVDLSYVP